MDCWASTAGTLASQAGAKLGMPIRGKISPEKEAEFSRPSRDSEFAGRPVRKSKPRGIKEFSSCQKNRILRLHFTARCGTDCNPRSFAAYTGLSP